MELIINISILVVIIFIAISNMICMKNVSNITANNDNTNDIIYYYLLEKIIDLDLDLFNEKLIVALNTDSITRKQFYMLLKRYKDTAFHLYKEGYVDAETYIDLISRL